MTCKNLCFNYTKYKYFYDILSIFENAIAILPITYQNKLKCLKNTGSARFIYKKWQIMPNIYKMELVRIYQ